MREMSFSNVPQEWRVNYKNGVCPVCAKTKLEFDKGQRVFCSKKCRDKYSACFVNWSELREKALKHYGEVCASCTLNEKQINEQRKAEANERFRIWATNNQQRIAEMRDRAIVRLDVQFATLFAAVSDDKSLVLNELDYSEKAELRFEPEWRSIHFEVDHKVAIVNGGSQWDLANLQVLCSECHKKKTAKDVGKAVFTRKAKGTEKLEVFGTESKESGKKVLTDEAFAGVEMK